jgi:hypothetical protein
MAILSINKVKGDGPRFRALGPHPMANRLLRIFWHKPFQFRLGALVFKKCGVSSAKGVGEFCPGVRRAHIHDADRRNARFRRPDTEEGRWIAALHAAPELPLSSDDEMLVKGIRWDLNRDPLAATGND